MNVPTIEGRKNDIRINTLAPTAATRMTEELLSREALVERAAEAEGITLPPRT